MFTRHACILSKPLRDISDEDMRELCNGAPSHLSFAELHREHSEIYSMGACNLNEVLLSDESSSFPQMRFIKKFLGLVQPHNMEVERGFNQTRDIISLKRASLSHEVYRDIKIVKRSFPSYTSIGNLDGLWGSLHPQMKKAASEFKSALRKSTEENAVKRKRANELRTVLDMPHVPLAANEVKRMKTKIHNDLKEFVNKSIRLQKQLADLEAPDHIDLNNQ